jgi:hypothetical protein
MRVWTMNSATSTESQAFQPWQLFTLAGLIGATIVVFFSRGQTPSVVILLSLTIFTAAGVGVAALRTVGPLTGTAAPDVPQVVGGRTRAALEREKSLVLRSIKELEFDSAMGKLSEKDFSEMSARLRARAARLMRELDAGTNYRGEIEKELARRLGAAPLQTAPAAGKEPGAATASQPEYGASQEAAYAASEASDAEPEGSLPSAASCASCGTLNDPDARFCKSCGQGLAVEPRS